MTTIFGFVGRICCGKETCADIFEKNFNVQKKKVSNYDLDEIFNTVLKIESPEKQIEYLQDYAKQISQFKKSDEKICKQAFLDWVKINPDSNNIDAQSQVVYPFNSKPQYDYMQKRNYFQLVAIDCPFLLRFKNFKKKYPQFSKTVDIELFGLVDDQLFYNSETSWCSRNQKLSIQNLTSIEELEKSMIKVNMIEKIKYRPSFDEYFMEIAFTVKSRSNCMKRAVGAVLAYDNRILSTGYNGTPQQMKNCFEGGCRRCNSNASQGIDLSKCVCIHAEAKSIMEIGIHKTKGATLYTTLFPCVFCAKIIMQAKIKKVVYAIGYDGNKSESIMRGVEIVKVIPLVHYAA